MSLTALVFFVGFAAGCLLAFVRHPIYGLMTYVGVFFVHPPSRWWGQGVLLDVRWALVASGVTLLAVLFHRGSGSGAAPFMRQGVTVIFLLFLGWLGIQLFWALDRAAHAELLEYYVKFALVLYLIHRCVDSDSNLRLLLWTYVLGCFYFGWIALVSYQGGRFEGFGGPGIGEANAGALALVIGVFAASGLFLAGDTRERVVLLLMVPVILNGVVTTVSRSGFLAMGVAGLIFMFFAPSWTRTRVRIFAGLGLVLFLMLTGPTYWSRMQSIEHAGEEVEGVDTGSGRIVLMQAQWAMFLDHPLGCGSTCTALLSRYYLDAEHLVTSGGNPERASHNTFLTMLVEHGVPGALFYVATLFWVYRAVRRLARDVRGDSGLLSVAVPAAAAMFGAIVIGDVFVQYGKFEPRIWVLGLLMAMLSLCAESRRASFRGGERVGDVSRPQEGKGAPVLPPSAVD